MHRIWTVAIALLFAVPAAAQDEAGVLTQDVRSVFARGCGDDRGNDRCDPEEQARMHALHRIVSPQEALEQKIQMRRAMFVDGYGRDIVSVTFLRAPGESPRVSVAGPIRAPYDPPAELSAPVSHDVWIRVLGDSEHFNRDLVSEEGGGDLQICLHGAFTVVEAVDPPRRPPNLVFSADALSGEIEVREAELRPGRVRVDAESACASGLAVPYAYKLARIAVESLPQCATLDPDDHRGNPNLLAACQRLRGDRMAAGEAAVLTDDLRGIGSDSFEGNPQRLFAGFSGDRTTRFIADLDGGSLGLDMPHASDVDNATIRGMVGYFEGEDTPPEYAPIELTVARIAHHWVVVDWEIGERALFVPDARD